MESVMSAPQESDHELLEMKTTKGCHYGDEACKEERLHWPQDLCWGRLSSYEEEYDVQGKYDVFMNMSNRGIEVNLS